MTISYALPASFNFFIGAVIELVEAVFGPPIIGLWPILDQIR